MNAGILLAFPKRLIIDLKFSILKFRSIIPPYFARVPRITRRSTSSRVVPNGTDTVSSSSIASPETPRP
ncbi:MAG: hypothetical protein E5299_01578 [Burkholderia gladioli]|nr:MAG: hypothetical protein E5299_01578 [Burkholderia gladioli]